MTTKGQLVERNGIGFRRKLAVISRANVAEPVVCRDDSSQSHLAPLCQLPSLLDSGRPSDYTCVFVFSDVSVLVPRSALSREPDCAFLLVPRHTVSPGAIVATFTVRSRIMPVPRDTSHASSSDATTQPSSGQQPAEPVTSEPSHSGAADPSTDSTAAPGWDEYYSGPDIPASSSSSSLSRPSFASPPPPEQEGNNRPLTSLFFRITRRIHTPEQQQPDPTNGSSSTHTEPPDPESTSDEAGPPQQSDMNLTPGSTLPGPAPPGNPAAANPIGPGVPGGPPFLFMIRPDGAVSMAFETFGPFGPTPQAAAIPPPLHPTLPMNPLRAQAPPVATPHPVPGPQVAQPPPGVPNAGLSGVIGQPFLNGGPPPWTLQTGFFIIQTGVPAESRPDHEGAEELLRSLPDIDRRTMRRIDRVVAAEQFQSGCTSLDDDELKGWECGVCLEGVDDWRAPGALGVKALPCNHFFHGECLRDWFVSKRTW